MRKNFGLSILIFIFFINLLVNIIWGWSSVLDDQYPWFDIALHFLGGLGVYLIIQPYFSKSLIPVSHLPQAIFLIGTTILVGVLWEFAEYFGTQLLRYQGSNLQLSGDLPDTITDLVLDLLGGMVGATSHLFRTRKFIPFLRH